MALDSVRAGKSLPDALAINGSADIEPGERAFARRLAATVLRQRNRLDARLAPALKRAPNPRWLRELIEVGLVQLDDAEIADHAALSATVEAAPQHMRGLVNAILRRASRGDLPVPEQSGVRADAVAAGLPEWLLLRLRKDWEAQLPEVIAGTNQAPPMVLRVNQQQTSRDAYQKVLAAVGIDAQPIGQSGLVLQKSAELARLPGFDEGTVSVQNASAQLAAELLAPEPKQTVLDACAAPGGKTAHLLEQEPTLQITALDADADRLEEVEQGLQRLGFEARCVPSTLQEYSEGSFARILLDVPCSATGVMRRHPEIRWLRREGDIPRLVAEQKELLAHAWGLLDQGGVLLFASCSILLTETEGVVAKFVQNTADAEIDAFRLPVGEALEYGWRIPPGGPWDGFYYARIKKSLDAS